MRSMKINNGDKPDAVSLKRILIQKNLSVNGACTRLKGLVTVRTLYRWLDGASDINYVLYNQVMSAIKSLKENI